MIHRLIMPLVLALALSVQSGFARADSASPVPASGGQSEACKNGFTPLRDEVEQTGKLIKVAGARHAPPVEACKLIGAYSQAEIKMIKYVETNAQQCGIQPLFVEELEKATRQQRRWKRRSAMRLSRFRIKDRRSGSTTSAILPSI